MWARQTRKSWRLPWVRGRAARSAKIQWLYLFYSFFSQFLCSFLKTLVGFVNWPPPAQNKTGELWTLRRPACRATCKASKLENTWEHMRTPKVGSCWIMKHSHPIILTWLKLLTSGIDWLTRSRGNCLQSESCEPQRPGGFWPEFRRPKVEGQKVPDAIHELWLIWLISITATNSIEF